MTASRQRNSVRKLIEGLESLKAGGVAPDEAIHLLELSALLRHGGELPLTMQYEQIDALLRILLGEALSSNKVLHMNFRAEKPTQVVRIARGVDLMLSLDFKLVALEVDTQKFQEGRKAMAFVGMGHTETTDVAERHDDYLVDAYLDWEVDDER